MGDPVSSRTFTREQRTRYRERLIENLGAFADLLREGRFEDERTIGLEVELNLVDDQAQAARRNTEVLDRIDDDDFQTEIGAHNIEMNYPVTVVAGDGLRRLEEDMVRRLADADEKAQTAGTRVVAIGTLPTLTQEALQSSDWMTQEKRYAALSNSVLEARGEDVLIDIEREERVTFYASDIAPEAGCTSVQFHLQVAPEDFAAVWNIAQLIAAPQVALGANSPLFLGRRTWHETRIELFKQGTDTRLPELVHQGVRPIVWFGERWIDSVFDLFEENVRYFPALLPEIGDEDPQEAAAAGRVPELREMRLHNGTVYRWNRPIYDPADGRPHLRIENRLLPAGPTPVDTVANAAFFYGLVEALRHRPEPLWRRMSFATAARNFQSCARDGLGAYVYWPGEGELPVDELIVRVLLPLAGEGLQRLGVDDEVASAYIETLRGRAVSNRNGAQWQLDALTALEASGLDRPDALTALVEHYIEGTRSNRPVHEWPLPGETG